MSALKTEANAIIIGQIYVFNNVIPEENNVNANCNRSTGGFSKCQENKPKVIVNSTMSV